MDIEEEENNANFALHGAEAESRYIGTWKGVQFHQGKTSKQLILGEKAVVGITSARIKFRLET